MKEGELIKLVRVRFPGSSAPGIFRVGKRVFNYGEKVVAMSERGMTIGFVNSQIYERPYSKDMKDLLYIEKSATDEDVLYYKNAYQEQKKARNVFNELVSKHNLPMKLHDIEYASRGKKIIFIYTAPNRIDFRNFLKDLVNELHCKIELRQIFDRQKSCKIGPCSPELCLFINSLIDKTKTKPCSANYCCLEDIDKEVIEKENISGEKNV